MMGIRQLLRGQFELVLDNVGDDLGIGLGGERVAFGDEGSFELEVVLDDAVVHDDERAGAVAVGGGRSLRWAGRGWPSGCGRCRRSHGRDRGQGCW